MKAKIGKKTATFPRTVIVSHMANLLATRAMILRRERDYKNAFLKYKDLCDAFIRQNKKFVYSFGDDEWLEDFLKFEEKLQELVHQELHFKFSDNSVWSVSLNDIANLKILHDSIPPDKKMSLLSDPTTLATWAEEKLTWEEIKGFASIRNLISDIGLHEKEWPMVPKKVVVYNFGRK